MIRRRAAADSQTSRRARAPATDRPTESLVVTAEVVVGLDWWIDRRLTLEKIRCRLRAAYARSSLAELARETGVVKSTLHFFLTETTRPGPRNQAKLRRWFLRHATPDDPDLSLHILRSLLPGYSEAGFTALLRELLAVIGERYAAAGIAVPAWIASVRAAIPAEADG